MAARRLHRQLHQVDWVLGGRRKDHRLLQTGDKVSHNYLCKDLSYYHGAT